MAGKGGNQQSSLFMAPPDDSQGITMVKQNSDDTYDIVVLGGLVQSSDNRSHKCARFVNGKMLPGYITVDRQTEQITFPKVKPNSVGEVELGLNMVHIQDPDLAFKLTIPKSYFVAASSVIVKPKTQIIVDVGFPGPDGSSPVSIQLIDETGNGRTGDVKIKCSQKFSFNAGDHDGLCKFTINDPAGINTKIKPTVCTEGFNFQELLKNTSTTETVILN